MTHKTIIGIIFNVGTTEYSYSTILQHKMELLSVYYVVIYIFSVYKKKISCYVFY